MPEQVLLYLNVRSGKYNKVPVGGPTFLLYLSSPRKVQIGLNLLTVARPAIIQDKEVC